MNDAVTGDVLRGERAEIGAWESVWTAASPGVREALGLSVERAGAAAVFRATGGPMWFFNRVVGLGIDGPVDQGWLDGVLDEYADAGQPHGVSLCPDAIPAELPGRLAARGLRHTTTLGKLMRDTRSLPSVGDDHAIRETGVEDADRFADTSKAGFGLPDVVGAWFRGLVGREGWRCYLALDAGEPVGTGALFVRGDVAWLGFGSTVERHRGRGLHQTMMARRMRDAANLGCRWLVTETNLPDGSGPSHSFANMRRLGFEVAYERPNYVHTPAGAS